jgi:hypothetical protein
MKSILLKNSIFCSAKKATLEALFSAYKKRIIDKILKCIAGQELLINETRQTI